MAIFPGGSIPERRWGAERFKGLTGILNAEGIPVVVVGGKEDAAAGEIIITDNNGINLAGKTSLVETAAVIEKSAVLVSGDSGILHVGVGLDRPTVSLFGPGIANKWAPQGKKHIVINKNLPCSPCTRFGYTQKCPISARCMAEITVDEVAAAVGNLIRTGEAKR
ncbi:MAG TPA: glycosyltransferase family 9 protein [Geobacteraceae bacterium]|nr:glycosyltransferase family 9 protein [Geobacteraceae bacterium]